MRPVEPTNLLSEKAGIRKILQIIPASGWYAVYTFDGTEDSVPLVCWALSIDEEGHTVVCGLDTCDRDGPQLDFCEESENFVGYTYQPVTPLSLN